MKATIAMPTASRRNGPKVVCDPATTAPPVSTAGPTIPLPLPVYISERPRGPDDDGPP